MIDNMGLYQGKRKDNGEWVEGCGIIETENWVSIFTVNDDIDENSSEVNEIEVLPETVRRCTEITDKNCVDIYVGDIVKIADFQIGQVVFECGAFGIAVMPYIDWNYLDSEIAEYTGCDNRPLFCYNDNFISFWELMWNYNQEEEDNCCVVEVIGNIHDNPELLKGGNNNEY